MSDEIERWKDACPRTLMDANGSPGGRECMVMDAVIWVDDVDHVREAAEHYEKLSAWLRSRPGAVPPPVPTCSCVSPEIEEHVERICARCGLDVG